jgi:murein DD-endopeptidase MepM/ murein hydrolase activator NlpD
MDGRGSSSSINRMSARSDVVSIDVPLRGEWVAVTSPGDRIPSHGTDQFALRYAYDFLRYDRHKRFHPAGAVTTLLFGVRTKQCYGWGQPVHMPFDGEIVAADDGYPERQRVFPIREAVRAIRNAATFKIADDVRQLVGNYVVAKSGGVYAVFAHLAHGSVTVCRGQQMRIGEVVGRVGHTGNSTSPHLHFQLMDGPDPRTARGLPCAFRKLEVEAPAGWAIRYNVVPRARQRLRYPASR